MDSPASVSSAGRSTAATAPSKPWSRLDDHILLDLVSKHGDRWNNVVLGMKGRTLDQCKKRHEELRLNALAEQQAKASAVAAASASATAVPSSTTKGRSKKAKKKDSENQPLPSPAGSAPASAGSGVAPTLPPPGASAIRTSPPSAPLPTALPVPSFPRTASPDKLPNLLSKPANASKSATTTGSGQSQGSGTAGPSQPGRGQQGGSAQPAVREVLGERVNLNQQPKAPSSGSPTHATPAHRPSAPAAVREAFAAASAAQTSTGPAPMPPTGSGQPAPPVALSRAPTAAAASGSANKPTKAANANKLTLMSLMKDNAKAPPPRLNMPRPLGRPGAGGMPSPGPATPSTPGGENPNFPMSQQDLDLLSAARAGLAEHLASARVGGSKKRPGTRPRQPAPKRAGSVSSVTSSQQPIRQPRGGYVQQPQVLSPLPFDLYAPAADQGIHFDPLSVGDQPASDLDFSLPLDFSAQDFSGADLSSTADQLHPDILSSILGLDFGDQVNVNQFQEPMSFDNQFGSASLDDFLSQNLGNLEPMAPPVRRNNRPLPPPLNIPGLQQTQDPVLDALLTPFELPLLSAVVEEDNGLEELLSSVTEGFELPSDLGQPQPSMPRGSRPDELSLDEELELLVSDSGTPVPGPGGKPITVDSVLPEGVIGKRTRQKLSLQQFDLETLENMLPYSILQSLHMDVDQVRYNSFVKSLQADAARSLPSDTIPAPDEDEEEWAPAPAENEEFDLDGFAVPHDEIEMLLRENADLLAGLESDLGASEAEPIPAPENWAGNNGQRVFTEGQVARLKQQMQQNFQVVTQAYALQAALHGTQSKEAGIWRVQLQSMKNDAEWAQKTARTLHRENSHHWTAGLALVPKILSLPVDPAAPKAQAFIQKFNYPYTRKEVDKYRSKTATMTDEEKSKRGKKELTLPESVQKTIDVCKTVFSKELIPEIIRMRKGRMMFLPDEDSLLAIGVSKYGMDDWNEIQAYCLPTRTSKHLKARYRALTSRRGPDNEVKRIYLKQIQPMKLVEREMLIAGIAQHGAHFRNVLERVFPRYPKALLTRTWDALHALDQVQISFAEACEMGPAVDDPGPQSFRTDMIVCRHVDLDMYTVAGSGLEYIEQSMRLMLKERNLPSKDLRSRLSKGLQHAVIGGKICPLYSQCRIGPKDIFDMPAIPKRKIEAVDAVALAEQRKKRLRI